MTEQIEFPLIQHLLNGHGFDLEELIEKSERELDRIRSAGDPLICIDHLINASITISSLCDWTYNFQVEGAIAGAETAFARDLIAAFPQWAPFHEIANTAKHANRSRDNAHIDQLVTLAAYFNERHDAIQEYDVRHGCWIKTEKRWMFLVPILVMKEGDDRRRPFIREAEAVLQWWRSDALHAVIAEHAAKLAQRAANRQG